MSHFPVNMLVISTRVNSGSGCVFQTPAHPGSLIRQKSTGSSVRALSMARTKFVFQLLVSEYF